MSWWRSVEKELKRAGRKIDPVKKIKKAGRWVEKEVIDPVEDFWDDKVESAWDKHIEEPAKKDPEKAFLTLAGLAVAPGPTLGYLGAKNAMDKNKSRGASNTPAVPPLPELHGTSKESTPIDQIDSKAVNQNVTVSKTTSNPSGKSALQDWQKPVARELVKQAELTNRKTRDINKRVGAKTNKKKRRGTLLTQPGGIPDESLVIGRSLLGGY